MGRWLVAVMLVAALLAGIALRAATITGRQVLSHDGSIAYLAATGQQGNWHDIVRFGSEQQPYGQWTQVDLWQQFFRLDSDATLSGIARDLADWDLHPPLYFWLLHYATAILGVEGSTGPLLNSALDLLTLLLVFGAARYLLRDDLLAAVAALMWFVSPAAVDTMQEARHYSLFGLTGIAFAWQLVRVIDESHRPRHFDYAMLAALTCAGALTHYSFAMVVAAGLILAAGWSERTRLLPLIACIAAGVLLAVAISPGLLAVFSHAEEVASSMTLSALAERVLKVGYHLFDLWGRTVAGNVVLGVALMALLAAVILRSSPGACVRAVAATVLGPQRNYLLVFALLVFVLIGAAYIGFLVPRHAIGPRYLAPVWPLMAIGFVASVRHLTARGPLLGALMVFAVANSAWIVADFRSDHRHYQQLVDTVNDYDYLVVDQAARGALLPLLHEMRPDISIHVAHPPDLLDRVDDWEGPLREAAGRRAYVSNLFIETRAEDRRAIMELLRERGWSVPDEPIPLFPTWLLYPLDR